MLLRQIEPVSNQLRTTLGFNSRTQVESFCVSGFKLQGILHLLKGECVLLLRLKPACAFQELTDIPVSQGQVDLSSQLTDTGMEIAFLFDLRQNFAGDFEL